jgi:ribosome-binding protein aMBF1 (putative translation factor)
MSTTRRTATRKAQLISADDVFAKARKSPAYRQAYDALDEEFSLVAAMIKARMDSGLTQAEVAQRMNTTQAVVARLEGGGRQPSTRTLRRFAAATGHRLKIGFEPDRNGRSAQRARQG